MTAATKLGSCFGLLTHNSALGRRFSVALGRRSSPVHLIFRRALRETCTASTLCRPATRGGSHHRGTAYVDSILDRVSGRQTAANLTPSARITATLSCRQHAPLFARRSRSLRCTAYRYLQGPNSPLPAACSNPSPLHRLLLPLLCTLCETPHYSCYFRCLTLLGLARRLSVCDCRDCASSSQNRSAHYLI